MGSLAQPERKEACANTNTVSNKVMTLLAIATSIDALAVGISFSVIYVNLFLAVTLITVVTFSVVSARSSC